MRNLLQKRKLVKKMEDILKGDNRFKYIMLGRFQRDCEYFLGFGGRSLKHLWSGNVKTHIQNMKDIWNSFSSDEKPQWLTFEKILEYEKDMDI